MFLISLKAGGFGLNLTEADYCFLLDPWWNPATEAQAVDRTHRIGQTRNVMVYRLIAKDTIEEKVMALQSEESRAVHQRHGRRRHVQPIPDRGGRPRPVPVSGPQPSRRRFATSVGQHPEQQGEAYGREERPPQAVLRW